MNKKRGWFTKKTISNIIVICVGVLLFLALYNFSAVSGFIGGIWSVVSPFLIGIVIAFLLNMPMRFFERTIFKKLKPKRKRVFSLIVTYLFAFLVLGLLVGMVVPQVADSITHIVNNIRRYLDNFNDIVHQAGDFLGLEANTLDFLVLNYSDLITHITDFLTDTDNLNNLLGIAGQIGSGVYGALVGLIASVYMLAARDKLLTQCRRLLYAISPKRWGDRIMYVCRLSNRIFSGFISGKIIDSAIIGVICFLFMSVMNILSSLLGIDSIAMPFSVLISVIIGITNIIPFFGPFIGAIPSVLILLLVNPWSAVWFTIFIIVLQQLDGNLIGPKILGNSTGLPAMWVLISLIVFGGLFGFVGMLLGVPTTAVLYSLGSDFIETRLKRKGLDHKDGLVMSHAETSSIPYARTEEEAHTAESEPKQENAHDHAPKSGGDPDGGSDVID